MNLIGLNLLSQEDSKDNFGGITWNDAFNAAESSYSVTVQKNQNRFFRTVVH